MKLPEGKGGWQQRMETRTADGSRESSEVSTRTGWGRESKGVHESMGAGVVRKKSARWGGIDIEVLGQPP